MNLFFQGGRFLDLPAHRRGARLALFGAPYDGTSSGRPGSRFAPQAIRAVSNSLEDYSPYQRRDIREIAAVDRGDLELPLAPHEALTHIGQAVFSLIAEGLRPALLGGEHLCTLPVVQALEQEHPDLVVLVFDAHTDLRPSYQGSLLSHATVCRRLLDVLHDPQRLILYGLRSGLREEFELAQSCRFCGPFPNTSAQRLEALAQHLHEIKGSPLYVSLDLDVLDPAIFPGTGTPEPWGIFPEELWQALWQLQPHKWVGFDLVELCPLVDPADVSTIVAAKICRELLLLAASDLPILPAEGGDSEPDVDTR